MKQTVRKFISLALVLFLLSLGSSSIAFGQTDEPTDQATTEATSEPTEEATAEPTVEATEEATAEPTVEATTEPTVEATEEATAEPTVEATEEATTEPTVEATEEATTEPTVEATTEPTVEATATLTPTVETTVTVEAELEGMVVNPPGQSSNVLLQNTENAIADVTVTVYNSSGGTIFNNAFQIAANGARTVHAGSGASNTGHLYMNLPNSTEASMVVQSSRRLVATNVNFGSPTVHNIYEGLESTSTSTDVLLPSIHWRDAQFSIIGIQNAGGGPANIEVKYFRQNGSQIGSTINVNGLAAGASNIRRAYQDVSIISEPAGVGSVRVTSTNGQALAVAVIETLSTYTYSYDGIPSSAAATKWSFPSVHRNPGGQFSHTLVQNTNCGTAANFTLRYFNQAGAQVNSFSGSIAACGALTFHTTNELSSDGNNYTPTSLGNVGSATVEITNGIGVVATVVETVGPAPYGYNGFTDSAGAATVLLPSVHRNLGGQFSHTLVQNTSTGASNNITLTYFNQDGSVANTFNKVLPASGSLTFHTTNELSSDGINYTPTGLGNVGSAKVVSNSSINVFAVVVETITGLPGSYAGFK
jgi:outer membrane biosynthesis protein TonB